MVGGRYEITGLIATGGMGEVYRARDTVLDRVVALKVLRPDGDPGFVSRFRAEATNAARLSHPNIVAVYDYGSSDGRPYMAMEYVDGQNLRDVLGARGVLRPDLAARIAHSVAQALEHARRNGIVHRDVKPENILITAEGQVKVADFGLSRALAESRATQAGVLLGTAHYVAPEQVRGSEVDHRADVYALGIVLYEMLAGRPPFTGDSPAALAYRRLHDDVPSARAVNPSVPPDLDAAIARATARRPDDRFPTAGAMADALRPFVPAGDEHALGGIVHRTQAIPVLVQETVAVQRPGARASRRRTRRRRAAIVGGALAALIVGVTLFAGPLSRATVPEVAGLSQEEAKDTLEDAGFRVDPVLRNDPDTAAGRVISQEPAAGARIRSGSLVRIAVSLGPELVSIPDIVGARYAAAERRLRSEGFTVARVDAFHDSVARLHVITVEPDPGLLVERGSTVTVLVSKGPEMVTVPNVVGISEEAAKEDLRAAGFSVSVERETSTSVGEGDVIRIEPKHGTRARKGTAVTIVVSKGAPLAAVPDLRCMTRRQAEDALAARGFRSKFKGSGNLVVDQAPAPGTRSPEGSTVTVYIGFGSFC